MATRQKYVTRFWSKVDIRGPDDCWEWRIGDKGYPGFWNGVRKVNVNRFALELKLGRSLTKDELACHTCDNNRCVNPKHLWVGSDQDNSSDMVRKNRQKKGEQIVQSKLKEKDVVKIRWRYVNGESANELSKVYKVCFHVIMCIVKGKTWRHVEGPICCIDMRKIRSGGHQRERVGVL